MIHFDKPLILKSYFTDLEHPWKFAICQDLNFSLTMFSQLCSPPLKIVADTQFKDTSCCRWCCYVTLVVSDSVRPHRQHPTRLPRPWDSPGKNTGVGCHFLLQSMKVKRESEVAQSCLTLSDPIDCSLPGSSVHARNEKLILVGEEFWMSDWIHSRNLLALTLACTCDRKDTNKKGPGVTLVVADVLEMTLFCCFGIFFWREKDIEVKVRK